MLTTSTQISIISYLFDAFPPPATLSALTIAASLRLLVAAAIPLVIIQDITALGGSWAS
jgi:DHA1 family multidrug resistance protein-like MFS transporter